MMTGWLRARLRAHGLMLASIAIMGGCGGVPEGGVGDAEPIGTASEAFTELAPNQTKVNAFYAADNIVDVTINLSDSTWSTIKTESPAGGECAKVAVDTNGEVPNRYPWREAGAVTITDSKGTTNVTFPSGVEIRKKSFCGSLTTGENEQPSLKLRISGSTAINNLGLQYIDLNNSKQDSSYIRQNLGYYLYGLAGLPRPRVNYAKVHIVTPSDTYDFIAINVEPIRGSFINNPDNGFTNRTITQSGSSDAKAPGNLYEIFLDDFDANMLTYVGLEKISKIQTASRPDLAYAVDRITTGTVAGTEGRGQRRSVREVLGDGSAAQALGRLHAEQEQHVLLQRRRRHLRDAVRFDGGLQVHPVGHRSNSRALGALQHPGQNEDRADHA
jgi:hypothetical protein